MFAGFSVTGFLPSSWAEKMNVVCEAKRDDTGYIISTVPRCGGGIALVIESIDSEGPRPTYVITPECLYEALETLREEGKLHLSPPEPSPTAHVVGGRWVVERSV
ncbi:MAG TPA: hypothetical protein GXX19_09010 [Syntrophomonadaceae bacterium]|nr:hypothetical protein [Syntrophomonadaceae bacterium]